LGGQVFTDFLERSPVRNRFIAEHVSESRPASIIDAFGKVGFCQCGGVHIAYRDQIKLFDQSPGLLVQMVCAGVLGFCVKVARKAFLVRSLCFGKPLLNLDEMARVFDLAPIGQGGQRFQAKVNSDNVLDWAERNIGKLDNDIQEPITFGVLTEAGAVANLAFWQRAGIEHAVGVAVEAEGIAGAPQITPFEGNPSERLPAAPAEIAPAALRSGLRILGANSIDGSGIQSKLFTRPAREPHKLESRRPPLVPFNRLFLNIVTVVPNVIHCTGLAIQFAIQGFNAVFIGYMHGLILPHNRIDLEEV